MAPRISATRHVIQIDELAFSLNPITRARGVRIVMSQSFRPLNTKEKHNLLVREERNYYTTSY